MATIVRIIAASWNGPPWRHCALLVLLLFAAGRLPAAETARTTPAMGRLNIDGEAVESIRLEKRVGRSDAHTPGAPGIVQCPGSSVSLPTGEYLLQQINLKGGYSCNVPFSIMGPGDKVLKGPEWLTISPGKPCSLKIGAPLKPAVRVFRHGSRILIAYHLLDSEGRSYVFNKRDKPPRFTVFDCSGREVGSGSFEYG